MKKTLAACVVVLVMSSAANATVVGIGLTGDVTNTTEPESGFGTKAVQLFGTLNDDFAYDSGNPTSSLPANIAFGTGIHGTADVLDIFAFDFDATYDNIFIDIYGRADCCQDRDDNFLVKLYKGGVHQETISPLAIPDDAGIVTHLRVTASAATQADSVRFVDNAGVANEFTLVEVRANGVLVPEPSGFILITLGLAGMGLASRRRRRKA